MFKKVFNLLLMIGFVSILSVPAFAQKTLTVGIVQKDIYKGITQEKVIMSLGSPNIVTQDSNGKETWVYDKMSSSISDSNKNENAIRKGTFVRDSWHTLGMFLTLGLLVKGEPEMTQVSQIETSQSTLTIVIKFDEHNLVESYSYHSSKF